MRIVLTALVILHHVALVYGGSGGWYWREQPGASSPILAMFNAINQAFFMGFFFLHPPIVVGASLLLATWTIAPLARFAMVGIMACIGSFAVAALLRSIPGVRQIV